MFSSELMHHMHAELILEHLNFKKFYGGSMPPDPPRYDGFHCMYWPPHISTLSPKTSTYTAVKPCIRMRY